MAFSFKKFWKGINIVPKTSSTADEKGDLEVLSSNGKLNYHNGTNASPIVTEVLDFIRGIEPVGEKLVSVIPSKSGCHIITTPFNPVSFTKVFPKIAIQKDNPTNLYIV